MTTRQPRLSTWPSFEHLSLRFFLLQISKIWLPSMSNVPLECIIVSCDDADKERRKSVQKTQWVWSTTNWRSNLSKKWRRVGETLSSSSCLYPLDIEEHNECVTYHMKKWDINYRQMKWVYICVKQPCSLILHQDKVEPANESGGSSNCMMTFVKMHLYWMLLLVGTLIHHWLMLMSNLI